MECPSNRQHLTFAHFEVCFAAGTRVLMADGTSKAIETICAGERVLSVSESEPDGAVVTREVVRVFHNNPQPLQELSINGHPLHATPNHPFHVPNVGWISASSLEPGMCFRTHNGRMAHLDKTTPLPEPVPVFNLQIADTHTYFVQPHDSDAAVLVHNQSNIDHKISYSSQLFHRMLDRVLEIEEANYDRMIANGIINRLGQTEADADYEIALLKRLMQDLMDRDEAERVEQAKKAEEEWVDSMTRRAMNLVELDALRQEGPNSLERRLWDIVQLEIAKPIAERQNYLDTTPAIIVEIDAIIAMPGESIRTANAIFDDPSLVVEGFKWTIFHPDQAFADAVREATEPGGTGPFIVNAALGGCARPFTRRPRYGLPGDNWHPDIHHHWGDPLDFDVADFGYCRGYHPRGMPGRMLEGPGGSLARHVNFVYRLPFG